MIKLLTTMLGATVALAACGHARPGGPPATAAAPPVEMPVETAQATAKTDLDAPPDGEKVPLSTSMGGLLKPGAIKMIQQRLATVGTLSEEQQSGQLDGATHAALARFQESNDLPSTGDPDGATVGKLGLKPGDVFRSGVE